MDEVKTKEVSVIEAKTIKLLQDWKPLIRTITSDAGKEFANHTTVGKEPGGWCRASENLNGLVRQYFPKKSDFSLTTETEINQVIYILNNRPRKR
jgi:IS30 family transposase